MYHVNVGLGVPLALHTILIRSAPFSPIVISRSLWPYDHEKLGLAEKKKQQKN